MFVINKTEQIALRKHAWIKNQSIQKQFGNRNIKISVQNCQFNPLPASWNMQKYLNVSRPVNIAKIRLENDHVPSIQKLLCNVLNFINKLGKICLSIKVVMREFEHFSILKILELMMTKL